MNVEKKPQIQTFIWPPLWFYLSEHKLGKTEQQQQNPLWE